MKQFVQFLPVGHSKKRKMKKQYIQPTAKIKEIKAECVMQAASAKISIDPDFSGGSGELIDENATKDAMSKLFFWELLTD